MLYGILAALLVAVLLLVWRSRVSEAQRLRGASTPPAVPVPTPAPRRVVAPETPAAAAAATDAQGTDALFPSVPGQASGDTSAEGPAAGDEPPPLPRIPSDSDEWQEGRPYETMLGGEDDELPPVERLIEDLRTGNPEVCHRAVEALVKHGAAAVAALESAARDPDPDVRVDAAQALARIRDDGA